MDVMMCGWNDLFKQVLMYLNQAIWSSFGQGCQYSLNAIILRRITGNLTLPAEILTFS